ncbi:MAG: polysaccharide biosynthesis tyrosine autokinase [Pseudonocardia sp.]|nr:polysaccharide biosynthesis tyrosine autokinase [Pseudonocardia sp.]
MDLRAYLAVLAKRWMMIVGISVTFVFVAAASIFLTTPTYRATAQLFVSTEISTGNVNQELYQGGIFSGDRVKSYTQLATSPVVLGPVVTEFGLPTTARRLAEDVQATAPLDTVLIDVTVDSTSPDMAATLANAVGNSLSRVIEDIETSKARSASPVKVTLVTPARVPDTPYWPSIPLVLALSVLIGLIAGIASALLVEKLDTSVKSADNLRGVADLPILAEVGRDRRSSHANAIVRNDPQGVRSEAYRQLRTNLQFTAVGNAAKIILVTSALPREGKSSVAGNLALALAQLGGRGVCLIDGDLRRPSVADYFGLVGEAGVSSVIVGRAGVDDVLQPVDHRLLVITSGVVPPNPTELLSSSTFAQMLKELSGRFDTIIVDAPPVLPAADAAVLAAAADGVIFVVNARTRRQDVQRALSALEQVQARMLGAVLNMVALTRQSGRRYGYTSNYTYSPVNSVGQEMFRAGGAPPEGAQEKAVLMPLLPLGSTVEGRPGARNGG